MIVTCPSCEARYRADPEALVARDGRVRCAACGHAWTLESDPVVLNEPVDAGLEAAAAGDEEADQALRARPMQPHEMIRRRAEDRQRKRDLAMLGAGWAGVAAMIAVVFGAAWLLRVDIVRIWPQSGAAYAAIGAEVNPFGLEVRDLAVSREESGGVPAIAVEGDVVNITARVRAVPPLRASVLDADGAALVEWVILLESPELGPDGVERFRTVLPDPPEDAAQIEVVFAPEARPESAS